ncbi:MAG: hypothetical protein EXR62_13505 [Chloroflexi bacterium]|nr:hypothetical protein [Chloroflexota bacterium]
MLHEKHLAVSEQMSLALDGGLSAMELAELKRSTAECTECAQLWWALRQMDRMLALTPPEMPMPDFTIKVMARISHHHSRRLLLIILLVLGCLGILALLAIPLIVGLGIVAGVPLAQPSIIKGIIGLMSEGGELLGSLIKILGIMGQTLADMWGDPMVLGYGLVAVAFSLVWLYLMPNRPRITGNRQIP